MRSLVVDVRREPGAIPGALCVCVDEIAQWTGEVLRCVSSDLDATIIVLGASRDEAERAAGLLSDGGFVRVRAWSAPTCGSSPELSQAPGVSAR